LAPPHIKTQNQNNIAAECINNHAAKFKSKFLNNFMEKVLATRIQLLFVMILASRLPFKEKIRVKTNDFCSLTKF
jgi:hypothetical protein